MEDVLSGIGFKPDNYTGIWKQQRKDCGIATFFWRDPLGQVRFEVTLSGSPYCLAAGAREKIEDAIQEIYEKVGIRIDCNSCDLHGYLKYV